VAVAIALFAAGIALGIGGAMVWAWAVHTGQLTDLERTKQQLFWPDIADPEAPSQDRPSGANPLTEAR
jgi:nitrogen fixation-related uncharacterized protein